MAIKELDTWPKAVLVTPLLVNGERPHVQEVIHAKSEVEARQREDV